MKSLEAVKFAEQPGFMSQAEYSRHRGLNTSSVSRLA